MAIKTVKNMYYSKSVRFKKQIRTVRDRRPLPFLLRGANATQAEPLPPQPDDGGGGGWVWMVAGVAIQECEAIGREALALIEASQLSRRYR